MPYGFEIGRVYNRARDIHGRFGGQPRGGIVTPAAHPLIFIFTGDKGRDHGYTDRWRADGVFEYFGQGQVGPMQMSDGNKAIVESWNTGEAILLFKMLENGIRFEGEMVYERHHPEQAPDTNGDLREAIVFELRRIENVDEVVSQDDPPQIAAIDLEELRRRAFAASVPTPERVPVERSVIERSRDVRNYVLARAGEDCESCKKPAPFRRRNQTPYLEAHHLRRLSDGGPDDPRFVIGVCPTCHRRAHHAIDAKDFNNSLIEKMKAIEVE